MTKVVYIKTCASRHYTDVDKKKIIRMASENKSSAQIARAMQRTISAIKRYCQEQNILLLDEKNSTPRIPIKDRAPSLDLAKNALQEKLHLTDTALLLMVNGRYRPAHLNDVMKETNRVRLSMGLVQIDNNPAWVVS